MTAVYMEGQRNDDATTSLSTVHYRGGETEFRAGIQLLASNDPMERAVGADVLAQLGWQDRAFLDESVAALLSALGDQDVCCSICHLRPGAQGKPTCDPANPVS